MNSELLKYPILHFFILFILSGIIRRFCMNPTPFSTSGGSIVMAIGIFSLDALKQLPFINQFILQLVALELLVIWIFLVFYYIRSYWNGYFSIQSVTNQFGIGTWVAGSSVLAILFLTEISSWYIVIWMLAISALSIWLFYLKLIFSHVIYFLHHKNKLHIGIILLLTVSTQSIVLLLHALFADHIPTYIYQWLILIGYLFYLFCIVMIAKYDFSIKCTRLILNWSSTNSIIHGALSITGLAGLLTHSMSNHIIIYTWLLATYFFVLVEGISLIKLIYRIRLFGWNKAVWSYDISQWARIFTYGMYYTFTLSLSNDAVLDNLITHLIIHYGNYVVFFILLFEIFLFASVSVRHSTHHRIPT